MLSTAIPPYVKSLIAAMIRIYNERTVNRGRQIDEKCRRGKFIYVSISVCNFCHCDLSLILLNICLITKNILLFK